MATTNSVNIFCISSVICLTCCANSIRSFKTHLFEDDISTVSSKNWSINVIKILHNNGSRARTTYIPEFMESRNLSRVSYDNLIVNNSVKRRNSIHGGQFQGFKSEQKDSKKNGNNYKVISESTRNNKWRDRLNTYNGIIKHMFNVCYLNCSKDANYSGSNESIIKTVLFKPRLKIKHAIHRKGNQLSKKALVKVVCRLPCRKDSIKIETGKSNASQTSEEENHTTGKFPKFLNLFTLINFPNVPCVSTDGKGGICFHLSQCQSLGGKVDGDCAQGYGVCCYIEQSCGESTALNGTYFTGTKFTSMQNSSIYICMLHIYKSHPSVKQLYIYLEQFELAAPVSGNCVIDRFVVTGQNSNSFVPEICGINSGQSFYVDVDSTNGPVSLTVLSSRALALPKNFKIRIFQLKEGNYLLAPKNCLQYYTSTQGMVESFNYQPMQRNSTITPGYTNNLNYAVCIRKETGYCSITYSNVDDDGIEYPFQLVNLDDANALTVPIGEAGVGLLNCPDDYIAIPGIRLCGYKLNDASVESDFNKNYPVTDTSNGPVILNVHTDGNTVGRGFHLKYRQNLCTNITMS